tara:strand:- start:725 stop:1294 length:570 start_codon:yes stop_codon:yes gene_type:complete
MASRGVNKVILLGNLGNDPEIKQLQNGLVANLSLATSETWKDKQTGQQQERTEWHRCVVYGKLAEIIQQLNVRKGAKVYLEGKNQTRKWQTQDGEDRYRTEVNVNEFQLLDSQQQGQGQQQGQQAPMNQQAPQPQNAPQQPVQQPAPQQQPQQPVQQPVQQPQQQQPAQQPDPQPQAQPSDDFDDDIPF